MSRSTIEQYLAFWNAGSSDEQQRLAAATLAEQVSYHAPVRVMHGTDELIAFRNQFAEHVPGYVFRARSEPEEHHDRARLQWELVVHGESFATGTDVMEFDDRGRVRAVVSFLDRAPEGFHLAEH
jgi:SnoaL-like domain